MDNSNEKIGFFKRIKIAVFNLENYGIFLGERVSKSFSYFLLLILLITVIIALAGSYNFYNMLTTGIKYISNELPDFSYNDGILNFQDKVEAYDHKYKFKLFIDTSDNVSDDTLNNYKNDIYSTDEGMILLKDKLIFMIADDDIEANYSDIISTYNFNISNKQALLDSINSLGTPRIVFIYVLSNFISMYAINLITILMDLLPIAIFGYIAARACGIRFKFAPMFTLSIYALTLSILLSGIYETVYLLTGFVVKYFNVMYLLIAYIYIIAAIFMIKYDLIKQTQELQKIIEVQKQVKKEAEEQEQTDEKEDKKDKEDKENKEDNKKEEKPPVEVPEEENKEPDGSEI